MSQPTPINKRIKHDFIVQYTARVFEKKKKIADASKKFQTPIATQLFPISEKIT